MKIKIKPALDALDLKNKRELAVFLGFSAEASSRWDGYLSELAGFRLLEKRPELRRLVEDRA